MNKRALSPLVATILLIAFAIALGVVVMSWGKSYIEEKAEFTAGPHDASACGVAELSIIKVGGEDKVCYNSATNIIESFVENGHDVIIDDIRVRIVGTEGIQTLESVLDTPLARSASARIRFDYPANIGDVQQIRFTPLINVKGEFMPCSKQAAVSEDIKEC